MSRSIVVTHGIARLISSDSRSVTVNQGYSQENDPRLDRVKREAVKEARRSVEQDLAACRQRQAELWAGLEKEFNNFISGAEHKIREQLVDLSVRIAEIIVRRELPDRAMVCDVIRSTLEPLTDFQGAKVRLNKDDMQEIVSALEESGMTNVGDRLEVVADPSLVRGDVLVETKNGYFDGRVHERLKLLQENLMERCKDNDSNEA